MKKKPDAPFPWVPAPYDPADANAIKALVVGTADEFQQKRAVNWIVNVLCGTYDLSIRGDDAGGDRGTTFAEGKRFVGLQIVKLININPDKLRSKDSANSG